MILGCEDGGKELSFSPKNWSFGIWEVFHSGQLSDLSFFGNSHRVSEKVSGKVPLKSLAWVRSYPTCDQHQPAQTQSNPTHPFSTSK